MPFEAPPSDIKAPLAVATGGKRLVAHETLAERIDLIIERNGGPPGFEQDGPRNYLGASAIGDECWRKIWYDYRHATKIVSGGRMRRLWTRGHREEPFFISILSLVGISVSQEDPESGDVLWYHAESDSYFTEAHGITPGGGMDWPDDVSHIEWHVARAKHLGVEMKPKKQWRFEGYRGHFSGSCDGFGCIETTRFLVEFKTSNLKRFKELQEKKVRAAQPKHYAQMQVYMKNFGLTFALYCCVCKDDDELYFEIVDYDPNVALENEIKAEKIIETRKPPARINNSPQFFKCKFCDHRLTCHFGVKMEKNCRTCVHGAPADGGAWRCNRWNANPPKDVMRVGCDEYKMITD